MSAYIVEDDLIILLAVYAVGNKHGSMRVDPRYLKSFPSNVKVSSRTEVAQEYAKILLAENYNSVNARYRTTGAEHKITVTDKHIDFLVNYVSTAQIAKACDCLEYQSCETADYQDSTAYKLITSIRKCLLSELSEYNSTAWGFSTPQEFHDFQGVCLSRLLT